MFNGGMYTGKLWEISVGLHQFCSDQLYPARLLVIGCLSQWAHLKLQVIILSDIYLSKWRVFGFKVWLSKSEKCVACEKLGPKNLLYRPVMDRPRLVTIRPKIQQQNGMDGFIVSFSSDENLS